MASKRIFKKLVNNTIIDIVEESFSAQLYDPKKAEASNLVIDEAIVFQDELLSKVKRAKSKTDFKAIYADFESKSDELLDKAVNL